MPTRKDAKQKYAQQAITCTPHLGTTYNINTYCAQFFLLGALLLFK